MTLDDELGRIDTIFLDTAPIIYYIEANPIFGPLTKKVVDFFQSGKLSAFSSVITLTEVLPKPTSSGGIKHAAEHPASVRRPSLRRKSRDH